jgi:hypothetical protein
MMEVRTEEERLLRVLLKRADALNTACLVIELEKRANGAAKEETLEALEEMRVEAREWFECYRRAFGIPDPLA